MLLLFAFTALVAASSAIAQSTHLINGDFETGNTNGWIIEPATSASVVLADVHGTGSMSRALEVKVPAYGAVLVREANRPFGRMGSAEASLSVRVAWPGGSMRPVRLAVSMFLAENQPTVEALSWHAEGTQQTKFGAFLGHPVSAFKYWTGAAWLYRLFVTNENSIPVTVYVDDLDVRDSQTPITRDPWGTVDVAATRLPLRVEALRPFYMTLMFVADRRVSPIQVPGYTGLLEVDPSSAILIGFGFGKIDRDLQLAPVPVLRGRELWFQSIELDVYGTHYQFGRPRLGGFLN